MALLLLEDLVAAPGLLTCEVMRILMILILVLPFHAFASNDDGDNDNTCANIIAFPGPKKTYAAPPALTAGHELSGPEREALQPALIKWLEDDLSGMNAWLLAMQGLISGEKARPAPVDISGKVVDLGAAKRERGRPTLIYGISYLRAMIADHLPYYFQSSVVDNADTEAMELREQVLDRLMYIETLSRDPRMQKIFGEDTDEAMSLSRLQQTEFDKFLSSRPSADATLITEEFFFPQLRRAKPEFWASVWPVLKADLDMLTSALIELNAQIGGPHWDKLLQRPTFRASFAGAMEHVVGVTEHLYSNLEITQKVALENTPPSQRLEIQQVRFYQLALLNMLESQMMSDLRAEEKNLDGFWNTLWKKSRFAKFPEIIKSTRESQRRLQEKLGE